MREDIIQDRKEKRERLLGLKIDPYPARVKRTHTVGEILADFKKLAGKRASRVFIAGRVRGLSDSELRCFRPPSPIPQVSSVTSK